MIPNIRTGQSSADLSVIWGAWIRDNRRKRNPWRFIEAHGTRDLALAHRDRLADPIFEVRVHRCAVGERV